MKILSLFDGISACQVALKNLGIEHDYYASEIDPYAIKVTQKNFPNTVQLGDVKDILYAGRTNVGLLQHKNECNTKCIKDIISGFDLLCGGSPCQDLSIAKKDRKGLDGERSGLFFEYVRILHEVKPKFFILENVASMSKEAKEMITKELFGIEPVLINSALVTAQQRKRLYWVGALQTDGTYRKVEISQPKDKGILLKDILESGLPYQEKAHSLTASYNGAVFWNSIEKSQRSMIAEPIVYSPYNQNVNKDGKAYSLGTNPQCQTAVAGQLIIAPVRLGHFNKGGQGDRVYSIQGKSVCLSANGGGRGACTGLYLMQENNGGYGEKELTNKNSELSYNESNFTYMNSFNAYKTGKSYNIPTDIINELVSRYENGASTEELADICEVNVKTIYKILKEAGVVLQPNRYRKYKFNEHYFDKIDTKEKAYWLGFLYADGSVAKDRDRISVALAEKDKVHIEKFATALEIDTPITYNPKTKSNRLVINSLIMKEALVKLGCVPNKSFHNVEVPLMDTPELCKAFIRGYFDGDGCLTYNDSANRYKVSFLGSRNLLMFINEFFELMLGLSLQTLMQDSRRKTDNTFIIEYSGKQNVLNILNYLYDGDVCLERKYNHYLGITNDDIRNRRKTGLYKIDLPDGDYTIRKLTPNECARLQGFPVNYHDRISNTQAYKCYGNSFTVPVIEHILKAILI